MELRYINLIYKTKIMKSCPALPYKYPPEFSVVISSVIGYYQALMVSVLPMLQLIPHLEYLGFELYAP